jgi:Pin2-interacting protein X1
MKMLKKMGWTEGKGLGKGESGITDCVQQKRREDGLGLGQEDRKNFNWNDNWWDTAFNSAIKKLEVKKKSPVEK